MSVLMYGIASSREATIDGAGVDRAPLRAVHADSLLAIVSDRSGPGARRTAEALREYGQVVERIAERYPLVPMRFASVLDDDDAVCEVLSTRRAQFVEALSRIRGAVEVALSVSWSQPACAHDESRTGRGYLGVRLELRRRAREIAGELTPLRELARTSRCQLPSRPAQPMRCAYLLDRDRLGAFTALVEQLDRRLAAVELVCTGPWPAYSFVDWGFEDGGFVDRGFVDGATA